MNLHVLLAWPLLGVVVGFIAGLLGIGGGAVLVPVFLWGEQLQGVSPQHTMHVALGTSLACIVASSVASQRAHHAHGAVLVPVVRRMALPLFAGSLAGTFLAAALPSVPLRWLFLVFLVYVGQSLLRQRQLVGHRELPGTAGLTAAGLGIGAFSALVGIGGASLSIGFLVWCRVALHTAIGTSAALGLPIALGGMLGFAWNGWGLSGLSPYSLGFVDPVAFAGVTATSLFMAPLGARLAHRLPVARLRRIFAGVLLAVAARMALGLTTGL